MRTSACNQLRFFPRHPVATVFEAFPSFPTSASTFQTSLPAVVLIHILLQQLLILRVNRLDRLAIARVDSIAELTQQSIASSVARSRSVGKRALSITARMSLISGKPSV